MPVTKKVPEKAKPQAQKPKKAPSNTKIKSDRVSKVKRKVSIVTKRESTLERKVAALETRVAKLSVKGNVFGKLSSAAARALHQMEHPELYVNNPVCFPDSSIARGIWSRRATINISSSAAGVFGIYIQADVYNWTTNYADAAGTAYSTAAFTNNESATIAGIYTQCRVIACCATIRPTAAYTALSGEFIINQITNGTNSPLATPLASLAAAQNTVNSERVSGQSMFHVVPYPQDYLTLQAWQTPTAQRNVNYQWGAYIVGSGLPASTVYSIDLVYIVEGLTKVNAVKTQIPPYADDFEEITARRSRNKSLLLSKPVNLPQQAILPMRMY